MPVTVEPSRVLQHLNRLLSDTGLSPPLKLKLEQIQDILDKSAAFDVGAEPFIDDVTGLQIPPPPPAETYGGHWYRLSEKMEAERFLATYWKTYTIDHPHMLFASHLRSHDSALDAALRNRARTLGESFDDFFFRHGILTQNHVLAPPYGLERQAALFKRMIAFRRLMNTVSDAAMKQGRVAR